MNTTTEEKTVKEFTIYWLSGKREVIKGESIEDAFTKAGYAAGATYAIDFYAKGDDKNYEWVNKEWVCTTPVFNPN